MIEVEKLDKFPLLSELDGEQRRALAELLSVSDHEEGCAVFRSGDEADALLLLESGGIRIETGGERVGELEPGDVLGACALLSIGRRECDALALHGTRLLSLSREGYLRLRADSPSAALALQEAIGRVFSAHVRNALGEYRASDDATG